MMENGKLTTSKHDIGNEITVLRVGGYIEYSTSDELDRTLDDLIKENKYNIILDLEGVDYISSRGWSIFLSKIKEIRENKGDLKLTNLNDNVYEVYKVLEFFWFMKVYDTMESAINDFIKGVPPMPEDGQTER